MATGKLAYTIKTRTRFYLTPASLSLSLSPCIEGTRITVKVVKELAGKDLTIEEIQEEYPLLSRKAIQAALEYEEE